MPGHFQQCAVSKSTEAPNATNHLCLEVYQAEVNLRAVKNIARLEMGFLWLWLLPADLGSETVTKKALYLRGLYRVSASREDQHNLHSRRSRCCFIMQTESYPHSQILPTGFADYYGRCINYRNCRGCSIPDGGNVTFFGRPGFKILIQKKLPRPKTPIIFLRSFRNI